MRIDGTHGLERLGISMNGRAQDGEHLSAYAIVDSTVLEEAAATIDRAALLPRSSARTHDGWRQCA